MTGGLKGKWISVQRFHLFRYRDEQVFRFNHRKPDDSGRFLLALESVVRRRLTYELVIGNTVANG